MSTLNDVVFQAVASAMAGHNVSEDIKTNKALTTQIAHAITKEVASQVELTELQNKLAVLFEYEKNYLTLMKDFTEEIKFAHALQEDLRKERAKFFSETLREVSATLTQAQVEETVASGWIMDLVKSYTGSLDLSGSLVDENALNTIGKIRAAAKNQVAELSLNEQNEPS